MHKTTRTSENATERFVATIGEINAALEALRTATADHFDLDPDEINWGHVGDARRVLAGLNEILAISRGENE